jgi:hypothetical protein
VHDAVKVRFALAACTAAVGDRDAALSWLDEIFALPDTTAHKAETIAYVYLELHDYDRFFEWMNKGIEKRQVSLDNVEQYPGVKPLLSDPRWKAMMTRANLEPL